MSAGEHSFVLENKQPKSELYDMIWYGEHSAKMFVVATLAGLHIEEEHCWISSIWLVLNNSLGRDNRSGILNTPLII